MNPLKIVARLTASPTMRFEQGEPVPAKPGLYVITSIAGECLHAGKSDTSLKRRILGDHLSGGGKGAGSDFVQKVLDHGRAIGRPAAKQHIIKDHMFRYIEYPDGATRNDAEYAVLTSLQPLWSRIPKSKKKS
jgi:hypothetical protein